MSNRKTTFYIVRHGQTEWNEQGLMQGNADSPLTEKGERQAQETSEKLKYINFDLVFSSDLLRAKRTAEIIALEHKLAVETTKLLRERNFGGYEGQPYAAMHAFDELMAKLTEEERQTFTQNGVENDASFIARILTFFRETAVIHPGKSILVVSHGGVMRSLLIHLGMAVWSADYSTLHIENASYIRLLSDGIDFEVKELEGITIKRNEGTVRNAVS
jgi:broad specificity phosphatase PhoE